MNSNRLTYEFIKATDFDFFYTLYTDEKVMYYAYRDVFLSRVQGKEIFDICLNENEEVSFIVYETDSKKPIGMVDYIMIQGHEDELEIGYFLLPTYWGQGYGFEMSLWIINYIFENTQCSTVIASCHCENNRSEALMKKLGMVYMSTEVNGRYKHGKYVDEIKYALTKSRWKEMRHE